MIKLLILPGSARRESFNRKLAGIAAKIAAEAGAEVDLVDPADFRLPLYDAELEEAEGLPENAKALKQKFIAAHAILFASPEYNSSITPLMKNTIDWVSRTETDDEPDLVAYRGKVAGLISASPGGFGGMRGLVHLRSILGNIGVLVTAKQFCLASAYDKFDQHGALKNEKDLQGVRAVVTELLKVAGAVTRA
ncbi:NAD(P)H-dependent oxidoreductase [Luteolibacter sp. GHJ8]|uniref:NAD(P)H-dependent oxidoreductase n=1 Tax=Luteolibacter rhizosphaerae TaxID=2989719 RepID=A0ABT3FXV9_9BACT|nr:NAD(P)H-dependent oxidoreductase [Luteolibacter rhizosphaerae]MCW1912089.1 NAD(P)H-dependent oxidoreductase [Luteolibacter rhizosphaerae]